jgi:hypothetical protein
MDRCRHCGSTDLETTREPEGSTHHARLACRSCDRFLKWLPRPAPAADGPPPAVMARVHDRARPCLLFGTEKQTRYARAIRETMLFTYARDGRDDVVRLLRCITDASWYIANDPARRRGPPRWPSPDRLEPRRPSGTCPACNGPLFVGPACSFECLDALQAAALRH